MATTSPTNLLPMPAQGDSALVDLAERIAKYLDYNFAAAAEHSPEWYSVMATRLSGKYISTKQAKALRGYTEWQCYAVESGTDTQDLITAEAVCRLIPEDSLCPSLGTYLSTCALSDGLARGRSLLAADTRSSVLQLAPGLKTSANDASAIPLFAMDSYTTGPDGGLGVASETILPRPVSGCAPDVMGTTTRSERLRPNSMWAAIEAGRVQTGFVPMRDPQAIRRTQRWVGVGMLALFLVGVGAFLGWVGL